MLLPSMNLLTAAWLLTVPLGPVVGAGSPTAAATSIGQPVDPGPGLDRAEDEAIEELERDLAGSDEKKRRSAVNKLVAMDTTKAWLVVVEALANDKAQPADEAQLDLATVTDEKVLKVLFGKGGLKHPDRGVRLRVAELLGRRAQVEPDLLAKALKERDPEVRRLLLWSVERLAEAGALGAEGQRSLLKEVERLMGKDSDGAVRGAALFAHLALVGPEQGSAAVLELADSKLVEARTAAAQLTLELPAAAALDALRQLAEDEDQAVRRASLRGLEGLAAQGSLAAVELLVERLEAESRPRLRWAAVDALQRVSGMGYRLDTRPWRRWLGDQGPDWLPATDAAEDRSRGDDEATVAFAGLPLLSDRVAFLIDFSGSIWTEKDGKLPKDQVGAELDLVLERLTEETWFNLIPYTNQPVPWEAELVPAKRKQLAAAREFYADCRARGAGNVYDAIQLALEDPAVDSIVVLTDGAPSGGTRWNLNLMVPALLEANRYRQVAFDSLLVGASGGLVRHWERLAQESGGQCISIDLK